MQHMDDYRLPARPVDPHRYCGSGCTSAECHHRTLSAEETRERISLLRSLVRGRRTPATVKAAR